MRGRTTERKIKLGAEKRGQEGGLERRREDQSTKGKRWDTMMEWEVNEDWRHEKEAARKTG